MYKGHIIDKIICGSIAQELGICAGSRLLSVNGRPIEDIFDYRFLINDEYVEVEIEDETGDICIYEIEKDYDEDIGLEFSSGLMDDYHSCSNKCIFCFIDQMPPGMRDTLYFKDDDSRLSFLQGNYVTLTNMKEKDIKRLINYRMEPINISVHTTDPELRCKMLHNRFAGEVLRYIDMLNDAGITMNGQIVLCKGINDGNSLDKTISDLSSYIPCMESVSVVPVGLTKFRDGLYPLEAFEKKDALEVIECVEKWQKKLYNEQGTHFIHASDEFYLLAEKEMPEEERYDGYLQLENGVGMMRLLENEFVQAVKEIKTDMVRNKVHIEGRKLTFATGMLAAGLLEKLTAFAVSELDRAGIISADEWKIDIRRIKNNFFGEKITVSGLLTGSDIIAQLKDIDKSSELLLPVNMLRSGEEYFLDDVTIHDVEDALGVNVHIVPRSGSGLLDIMLGIDNDDLSGQHYELETI